MNNDSTVVQFPINSDTTYPEINETHDIDTAAVNRNASQLILPVDMNIPSDSFPQPPRRNPKSNTGTTGKKSKSALKQGIGTTEEKIATEFSKAQLKTLQVKLKEQETSLKDLKFQNSVLLERIGTLEKPQKQALYTSFFPNQDQHDKQSQSCSNKSHSCSHTSHSCSHQSHSCLNQLHSCHSMISRTLCCCPQGSCISLQQQLNSISIKLDTLLTSMHPPPSVITDPIGEKFSSSQAKSSDRPGGDDIVNLNPEIFENPNSNDSVISIDHFMPDVEQEISLNSLVMTSRSHQPMLLE